LTGGYHQHLHLSLHAGLVVSLAHDWADAFVRDNSQKGSEQKGIHPHNNNNNNNNNNNTHPFPSSRASQKKPMKTEE
jgi:hypothetical protein